MDRVEQLRAELEAIEAVTKVLEALPDDATRRRVLSYVRQKVVPPRKREADDGE